MNKLETNFNGGMPLVLDDLRFTEQAHRDAFKGIVSGLLQDYEAVILSGCNLTDDNDYYQVSAGIIATQDEVFNVEAHSVVKVPQVSHVWYVNEENTQSKTYKDANSHPAYLSRTMQLADSNDIAVETEQYSKGSVIRLFDALKANLNLNQATGWQTVSLVSWLAHDDNNPVQIRRNIMGKVEIRGRFTRLATVSDNNIGNIRTSSSLRPDKDTRGLIYMQDGIAVAEYRTNGGIYYLTPIDPDNVNEIDIKTK